MDGTWEMCGECHQRHSSFYFFSMMAVVVVELSCVIIKSGVGNNYFMTQCLVGHFFAKFVHKINLNSFLTLNTLWVHRPFPVLFKLVKGFSSPYCFLCCQPNSPMDPWSCLEVIEIEFNCQEISSGIILSEKKLIKPKVDRTQQWKRQLRLKLIRRIPGKYYKALRLWSIYRKPFIRGC